MPMVVGGGCRARSYLKGSIIRAAIYSFERRGQTTEWLSTNGSSHGTRTSSPSPLLPVNIGRYGQLLSCKYCCVVQAVLRSWIGFRQWDDLSDA